MLFGKKSSFNENDFGTVVSACIAGNNQAQRYLYKSFFGYSKSICLRYTSTTEEAEEVLNEGFLKVFNNMDKYDSAHPFKAWLRTIMVNTAISYYRKHKKHHEDMISLEDAPCPRFDEDVVSQITADEILQLVQGIKPIYKNVFLLYVVDGYNHREIADLLQINEATVRSHYVRARARLQHLIKQHYPHLFPSDWGIKSFKSNEN
ncbi:RNA polymerase, sigma subunit, SigZ [Dyadobacter koreensis]|uniref:RNA polymerase, sigma subunit, SigZ n=1 Tax=Dyadobacter koreensis TaxID=408657 RepID=A0A1H6RSB6_9BACT|nr:sigma-70 family RNA polymerase sigma factor [Dyadobacter koreensis]SEI54062.1 RNA polymerase, sigma subunit, SigZ [Dyadobacter koreensis]